MKKVLLTGISGFLASHIALLLLERGYSVRGTLRNMSRRESLLKTFSSYTDRLEHLEFAEADLLDKDSWTGATAGIDYVIHTASPVPKVQPENEDEVIVPAREGTGNVLQAAINAHVAKIVLTSSVAAIGYGQSRKSGVFSEAHWTDPADKRDTTPYVRSKTIAESVAWEMVGESTIPMTAINPSVIFGPALERDYGSSLAILRSLLKGKIPGIPRISLSVVDVRDVADLHVLAMENPSCDGMRLIAAVESFWLKDIADLLRHEFPGYADKIPSRQFPDFVVKLYSLFDRKVRSLSNELGNRRIFDSGQARKLLGWNPRSGKRCIIEGAQSLIDLGIV